jgi:hypothetical protein
MFEVDFHILNQKATPAIYADDLSVRPNPGFAGRIFINTASPYGVYRDTGTSWVQIASNGGGGGGSTGINGLNGNTNIGLGGTLTNDTTINGNFNFSINSLKNISFQSAYGLGNSSITLNQNNFGTFIQNVNSTLFSQFSQTEEIFKTTFNSSEYGLILDDTTGKFVLGDYNKNRKYNSFVVNDNTDEIYINTNYNYLNNSEKDLFYCNNSGSGNRFVYLGDFNNYTNGINLQIDDYNQSIATYKGITGKGIFLNFDTEVYQLGDTSAQITCNVGSTKISFNSDQFEFNGTDITSSPEAIPISALIVYVNNTRYKINLY